MEAGQGISCNHPLFLRMREAIIYHVPESRNSGHPSCVDATEQYPSLEHVKSRSRADTSSDFTCARRGDSARRLGYDLVSWRRP